MAYKPAPLPNSNRNISFEIKERRGVDEAALEFAKMTILYSFNKYPNDDFERAVYIKEQFNARYGKFWSSCLLKVGGISFEFFEYWILIKYNDYDIHIWKSSR